VPAWLIVSVLSLAVFRLTRFIVADGFPPWLAVKDRLTRGRPEKHWLVYMLGNTDRFGCPWCVSIWVGGLACLTLAFLTHWFTWPQWVLVWGTTSALTGLLAGLDDD